MRFWQTDPESNDMNISHAYSDLLEFTPHFYKITTVLLLLTIFLLVQSEFLVYSAKNS